MSSGCSFCIKLAAVALSIAGITATSKALAQEPTSGEWRRVCPGKTAQTWYFAEAQGDSAGTWQAETPFILHEVQGRWALGTRAFDGKKAWINTEDVCHLDNRRRVCEVSEAFLFWSNIETDPSGREVKAGAVVSLLEVQAQWAKVEFNGTAYWILGGFLCPVDPNVNDSMPQDDDNGDEEDPQPGPVEGGMQTCGTPQAAFLSTIAYAEGTNDRYNIIFGFRTFSSFAKHPRRKVCSGRLCSTAAGRYQILARTWDNVIQPHLSLPDFTPRSQDRAGVFLVRNRGVRNSDDRLDYGAFSRSIYKLNREWASLPGSPYGQPTRSMNSLWSKYSDRLTCN